MPTLSCSCMIRRGKSDDKAYRNEIREIELIVEKNRQGERTLVKLEWNPEILTFTEEGYGGVPEPPSV